MKPEDLIICRCEGVTLSRIIGCIRRQGCDSVNQVKKLTRAGMGLCQGKTCSGLVAAILEERCPDCGKEAFRSRPPIRSVPMDWLAETAAAYPHPEGPTAAVASLAPDDEKSGRK